MKAIQDYPMNGMRDEYQREYIPKRQYNAALKKTNNGPPNRSWYQRTAQAHTAKAKEYQQGATCPHSEEEDFRGRGVMLRSAPKIYGNHRAYNNQRKRGPRSPFTRVSISIESHSISAIAMIVSGCSVTIIPSHLIPRDLRGHVSATSVEIASMQGSIQASAEVLCDITVGEIESPSFKEIRILVVSVDIPLLLGQDILSHKSVKEYSIDYANNAITFTCIMGVGEVTHKAALITEAEEITHQHVAVTSVISPRNVDSLPQKLKWLQVHMNVQLPQHPNRDELERVADLLIDYQDIIGT